MSGSDKGVLRALVPDRLWCAEQVIHLGPVALTTRMTVVRLPQGGLWVHSPIFPNAALLQDLHGIGEVHHVVAPNKSHHLFFLPFLEAFPSAQGWIAPGLVDKRPDLSGFPVLNPEVPWSASLHPVFIAGIPLINETAFFHRDTGTLILTDLLFCVGENRSLFVRTVARVLGIYMRPGMSRTMKLFVKDSAALKDSVAPLLSFPVERIVLAHDQIIEVNATETLRTSFAWLE